MDKLILYLSWGRYDFKEYFKRFIFNYKFFIFRVLYFEILYSLRYLEFGSHLSISKHRIATDTVPCIYYFLFKISKFIKKIKLIILLNLALDLEGL